MRIVDRILAILLALGGIGHTLGVSKIYHDKPDLLFWSLTTSALIFLAAALNLLRSWRPGDAALGWITAAGTFAYLVITLCFGRLIHNFADPRVVIFGIISAALTLLSIRSAVSHR
jgi:MFS family permease